MQDFVDLCFNFVVIFNKYHDTKIINLIEKASVYLCRLLENHEGECQSIFHHFLRQSKIVENK
jgi:hypothetical protein